MQNRLMTDSPRTTAALIDPRGLRSRRGHLARALFIGSGALVQRCRESARQAALSLAPRGSPVRRHSERSVGSELEPAKGLARLVGGVLCGYNVVSAAMDQDGPLRAEQSNEKAGIRQRCR